MGRNINFINLTIQVPVVRHGRLKSHAESNEVSMTRLVNRLIEQELKRKQKGE